MIEIIEYGALHIGRLMHAPVFRDLAHHARCDYLDARLSRLFQLPYLTNHQRGRIAELTLELGAGKANMSYPRPAHD